MSKNNLIRFILDFWNYYDFEDILYANFKAIKEKSLEIEAKTPLMPPFKKKEVNIYRNREKGLIFVEAFGENYCFFKNLIYSLNLNYQDQENIKNKFYIFTDVLENIESECPPSFFIIKTKQEELYQKVIELKEQIAPEPKQIFIPFYMKEIIEPEPKKKEDDGLIENSNSLIKKLKNYFKKIKEKKNKIKI